MRFEKLFERDEFLFDPFSTFRATTFERVRMRILVSSRRTTCESVVQKRHQTYFPSKLGIITEKVIFLLSALKILSKDTSLGPNGALVLEKHLCFFALDMNANCGKILHSTYQIMNVKKCAPGVPANKKQIF